MANSVLCTECGNWVHGRCAVTRLAMHFICLKCKEMLERMVDFDQEAVQ